MEFDQLGAFQEVEVETINERRLSRRTRILHSGHLETGKQETGLDDDFQRTISLYPD